MAIVDDYASIAAGMARLRSLRVPAHDEVEPIERDPPLPPARRFLISDDGRLRFLPRQPRQALRRP